MPSPSPSQATSENLISSQTTESHQSNSIINHQFPIYLNSALNFGAANISQQESSSTATESALSPTSQQIRHIISQASHHSYDGIIDQIDILFTCLKITGLSDEIINSVLIDTLSSIIRKYYDSQRVQNILFRYFDAQPAFFNVLLQDANFRRIVYDLSERYSSCEFLAWMVRWIAEKSEYRTELKAVASGATSQYDVFQKALLDSLMKIAHMTSERDLSSDMMKDFCNLCAHSECTYVYSQCVLQSLASRTHNPHARAHFRRISDELESHAIATSKTPETLLRKILFLIRENQLIEELPNVRSDEHVNPYTEITNSIVTMLSQHQTFASDIAKLHKYYTTSNNPPPIEFLRHADFLRLLLQDLYNPKSPKPRSDRAKYIHLLSIASVRSPQDIDAIQSLKKAFVETIEICSNKSSVRNLVNTMSILRPFTKYNVICMGVLIWIQNVFNDPDSFGTSEPKNVRIYLALIEEIAFKHTSLRLTVLKLAKSLLQRKEGVDAMQAMDLHRLYVQIFIYIFRLGHVLETIQCIREVATHVDLAILRYIVQQVLSFVAPPYSSAFLQQFCELLCFSRTQDAVKEKKGSAFVREFISYALEAKSLQLDSDMLKALQSY